MIKQIKSQKEIQEKIQTEIDLLLNHMEIYEKIKIPIPYRHEMDENNCNWSINVLPSTEYTNEICMVIAQIRNKYNI